MNATNETFARRNRVYTLSQRSNGLWLVWYRPINKKTGKPWQATHGVVEGHNYYQLWDYTTSTGGGGSPVFDGPLPPIEVWRKLDNGRWKSACSYFKTREDALAQIPKE